MFIIINNLPRFLFTITLFLICKNSPCKSVKDFGYLYIMLGKIFKDKHATFLKPGDKAPAINAKDQNGDTISLDKFKGKKVILFFYPKDNTPGCTAESCNLRDNYAVLKKKGYEVVGVSADSEKSHQKFIEKFKLPYSLIADTEKKVINDYGVWGKKSFMGKGFDGIIRTTFVIDEGGKIEKVISNVKTKDHAEQILSDDEQVNKK